MKNEKKLEIGEIVIIYNTNVNNFLIPNSSGKVLECVDPTLGIYSIEGEDNKIYTIHYPEPIAGEYGMLTRKEYIEVLKKEKSKYAKETRVKIAENNKINNEKNKKLEDDLRAGNNYINSKIYSVCSKYGHSGQWVLKRRKIGEIWNDWEEKMYFEYAPTWERKCNICNRTQKVLLNQNEDPFDWHKSWPKELIDHIESLSTKEKRR